MWEGGRCPWFREGQCRGRSLSAPRKRPETAATPEVARVSTTKPVVARAPREPRLPAGEARARKNARSAAYNAAHRGDDRRVKDMDPLELLTIRARKAAYMRRRRAAA